MAEPEIIQNNAPETAPEPTPFNWTLNRAEWTTTIFAKKKMRERCNIRLIYGFIKAEMGIAYGGLSRYSGMPSEIKTELDLVKNYKNLWKEKEKYFSVAHTLPKHKWGRTIPNKYLSPSIILRSMVCDQIAIQPRFSSFAFFHFPLLCFFTSFTI